MSLSRDTRNEKKLKLIRRAEFRLKQSLERVDWEEDVLLPELTEFKAKARLPELPDEKIISVEFEEELKPATATPGAKRDSRKDKK